MKRFVDKIAIVTGGRSGIGRAIALRLEKEGARVFTAQRNTDQRFDHVIADFANPDCPSRVVEEVVRRAGKIDVLVNSAGQMQETGFADITLEMWQENLMINLTAPFLMIKSVLPALRKTQGSIVNIGSVEGLAANPGHAAYCASKAGLHGLTRAVAIDHGHEGIRCNAVAPGWIDTPLNDNFIESREDPDRFRQNINGIHPVGRTGGPEEVAALVAFLAASESSFITGQIYCIDGGRMAKLSLP